MGLPIDQLVIGSNSNDVLTRFLATGQMTIEPVRPTLSPSMDIQVSSNVERLLFDLYERDGMALAKAMASFRRNGRLAVGDDRWRAARALFDGFRLDDADTLQAIAEVYRHSGELLDPHTAIGVAAGHACYRNGAVPMVALATAHPAKFPDAVEQATGIRPPLPPRLNDLFSRAERANILPNDLRVVQAFMRDRRFKGGA